MSFTARKLMSASGGAGEVLNVEDVFSTYLYEGNGSTQTITNGIDLSGEGGLVWIKNRDATDSHILTDTARGVTKVLKSNTPVVAETTDADTVTAFSSTGFSLGDDVKVNTSNESYCSWTFRKAPKFFDIVTYTGNGTAGRTVSHNLGSVPGSIIFKQIDDGRSWSIYHRGLNGGSSPEGFGLVFDTDVRFDFDGFLNDTAPTATEFTVGNWTGINDSGGNYIAYLFAHNNGDGEFGPDSDQDIIKCGSYTGNGSNDGPEIDLGFEPQWVLIKNTTTASSWRLMDVMRGFSQTDTVNISPDSAGAEYSDPGVTPVSTGFKLNSTNSSYNNNNQTFIYIAIRRGTKVPESGTEVFAIQAQAGGYQVNRFASSGFPVDFVIDKEYDDPSNWVVYDRLRGGKADVRTNSSVAESSNSPAPIGFDYNDGITEGFYNSANNVILPMWKRAPGFFDVVAYTGTGGYKKVYHNLATKAEMIWIKRRDSSGDWGVYFRDASVEAALLLNSSNAAQTSGISFSSAASSFSIFNGGFPMNNSVSGADYIAYLFASLDGVSKLGSYTGNGTSTGDSQNIDCGFTNGARFILVKRATGTGMWAVYDTTRGIAAGNDAQLQLNSSAAQYTGADYVDPYSAGFAVSWMWSASDSANLNANGSTYIFYAIA